MDKGSLPEITVLMPVYNAEQFIRESIESILNQTFTDFELLIIDDGSTDRSLAIVSTFSDPRIRILRNHGNRGVVFSLNRGVQSARGTYIARMDADDIADQTRLMRQYAYLSNHAGVDLCGSGMVVFRGRERAHRVYYSLRYDVLKAEALFNSPLPHPGVMVRKHVLTTNPYRETAVHAEDYELWSRLLPIHRAVNLPFFLLRYRVSENNITTLATAKQTERKRIISDIHQRNFAYLGYQPGPEVLELHYLLSSTEGIKQFDFGRYRLSHVMLHFRTLLMSAKEAAYCNVDSFYIVSGKVLVKLLGYNWRRMRATELITGVCSIYFWYGIAGSLLLRCSYICGMKKSKQSIVKKA